MVDIIGILLYNIFVELPESNQTFEGKATTLLTSLGTSGREKKVVHDA